MLKINLFEEQKVFVGDHAVELVEANEVDNQAWLMLDNGDEVMLEQNNPHQLLPNVTVLLDQITVGSKVRATLAFDAPKDVQIVGEWRK